MKKIDCNEAHQQRNSLFSTRNSPRLVDEVDIRVIPNNSFGCLIEVTSRLAQKARDGRQNLEEIPREET